MAEQSLAGQLSGTILALLDEIRQALCIVKP